MRQSILWVALFLIPGCAAPRVEIEVSGPLEFQPKETKALIRLTWTSSPDGPGKNPE